MTFNEVLSQTVAMLQQHGRVSYRSLRRQFDIDDEYLVDLKEGLLYTYPHVVDDGQGLIWSGETSTTPEITQPPASASTLPPQAPGREPVAYTPQHLAEKILTSRSALEGERKQVTVMFADIKDSTELIRDLDPEAAQQLLDPAIHIMMEAVHRFEGTVNQVLGDGIMSIFGAPIAHEDHAARACYAALAMQTAMQPYADDIRRAHGMTIRIRVGLNSGEVVVRTIGNDLHMDYSAVGQTTNLASRMEQLAAPGSITLTATTLRLVEGLVRVNDLGPIPVKGMSVPVDVYELTGASSIKRRLQAAVARGLTRFVGRETEIETLNQARERAVTGQGQVVAAIGEAGVGKSRLVYEFIHSHRMQGWLVLESASVSYGKATPYFPVIDLLKRYAHVEEGDDARAIRAKVTGQILTLDESLQETIPALLSLLDALSEDSPFHQLGPPQRRQRTLDGLKRVLLRESQMQPLLLVFEDLHWIDSETQALLDSLVESLPTAQMLMLCNYRPEYQHDWGSKTFYTQLRLDPLPPESANAFLASLLGGDPSLESFKKLLIERTEGNPFFLEESVRTLVEAQVLAGEQGGYRLLHELPAIQVPSTVQAILAARMDRLPQEDKRLLQTAAVIGNDIPFPLLQTIAELPENDLHHSLIHLQAAEFLYETNLFPERVYTFKHALTQNVAYQSLLTSTRQQYHRQIAHALEEQFAETVENQPEVLAHHFTLGDVWEKAFDYLVTSGNKARHAYANQEAIAFYTQALEVSERMTPALDETRLLPVYESRGIIFRQLTKYDEAIADFQILLQLARAAGNQPLEGESLWLLGRAHYSKASEDQTPFIQRYTQEGLRLAQQTGDQHILAQSLTNLGLLHTVEGNVPEAIRNLEAAVQISRQQRDISSLSPALTFLCQQSYFQGRFQAVRPLAEEGASVSRDLFESSNELFCLGSLCQSHWSLGDYDKALTVANEMSTKSQARGHLFFLSRALNTLGWFHHELGDFARAIEYNCESVELGRTVSLPNAEISALINLGLDYLLLSQHDRALAYLKPTLERVQREGFGSHRWRWTIRLLIGLSELSFARGDYEQAIRYVEEGLKEAQATTSQKYVALGRSLHGRIAAQRGDLETSGTNLRQAFILAEQLQSPSLIYPIAYDFGQWHERSGNEREAATLYGKARAITEQMATAVEDDKLRSTFLQSALVQEIHEHAIRLGG